MRKDAVPIHSDDSCELPDTHAAAFLKIDAWQMNSSWGSRIDTLKPKYMELRVRNR